VSAWKRGSVDIGKSPNIETWRDALTRRVAALIFFGWLLALAAPAASADPVIPIVPGPPLLFSDAGSGTWQPGTGSG
jgi:hypothetical protein